MLLRDDEAQAELKRSIQLQPGQTESYYELGAIFLEQRQDQKAAAEFRTVIARNPNHAGALAGLGTIAIREKRYADALPLLRHSLQTAPEYPETHRDLALALAKLGRAAEAQGELATAAKLTEQQDQLRHGLTLENPPTPPQ